jgi:ADP-ribose pyrophosphatase YjhB (NUDIX family)
MLFFFAERYLMKRWLKKREQQRRETVGLEEGTVSRDDGDSLAELLCAAPAHAVAIVCVTPAGIPLVRDWNSGKPSPIYWKLPGGTGEFGETPEDTALRELEEETGIALGDARLLKTLFVEKKRDHTHFFFLVTLDYVPTLAEVGAEDKEEIRMYTREQIARMPGLILMPSHRPVIEECLRDPQFV